MTTEPKKRGRPRLYTPEEAKERERKRQKTESYRERARQYHDERHKNDPEYREYKKKYLREYRQRKKAKALQETN